MEAKKTRKMNLSFLIALCNIIEKFDDFNSDLEMFVLKHDFDIDKLEKIFSGKFVFGNIQIKNFYKEHKEIIDLFNEYSDIIEFIKTYYMPFKTRFVDLGTDTINEYENLVMFIEYLHSHKNQIDNILQLLYKLQSLGFNEIELEESNKFSNENYQISTFFASNREIVYLENLECIPNHDDELVNYRSASSNYKITLNWCLGKRISLKHDSIESWSQTIVVNNLVFDSSLLPDEINPELMVEEIKEIKKASVQECQMISKAVELGVEFYDLQRCIDGVSGYVDSLGKFKNRGQMKKILLNMQQHLLKLKFEQDKYFLDIENSLPNVSEGYIQEELTLCLKRREEESKRS